MRAPPRALVLLVLVAASAVAAFLGTVGHGFVYDDHRFVAANPRVGFSDAFDPAATTADGGEPGMWRPVRALSFALDRALLGPGPAGLHLSSALLHGVAAGLVFAVGMALGMGDLGSAAGAAIFAFHPVQAEAVSWISARGDLLCGVFLLAAVLAHLRRTSALLVAGAVALAFLSKEAAVAAPLLLVAADFAAGGWERVQERGRAHRTYFVAMLLLLTVRSTAMQVAQVPDVQGGGLLAGPVERVAAIPSMFAWYAGRFLLPRPGLFDEQLVPSLLLGVAATAGVVILLSWERIGLPAAAGRPLRRGAVWALAALVPVTLITVLFPLKILVADRFLYLAVAGPALAAGAWAECAGPRAVRGLLVAAPLLLAATLPASARWASDEALWSDTLARDPGHPRALYGLAWAREAEQPMSARELYAAYVEVSPTDPGAWFRLGMLEERLGLAAKDDATRRGHLLGAIHPLGEAIRIWVEGEREGRARGLLEARLARASILGTLGQEAAAADEAQQILFLWPESLPAERERLRPRLAVLHGWATHAGKSELAASIEKAARP